MHRKNDWVVHLLASRLYVYQLRNDLSAAYRIAIFIPLGCRGIDRWLNFVAGGGDGVVYAESIRPEVSEQLDLDLRATMDVRAESMVDQLLGVPLSFGQLVTPGTLGWSHPRE